MRLAADWFGHAAELTVADESFTDGRVSRVAVRRVPHGVVAAIAPSGFPVLLSVCKVAPALLAVNTVVLKLSPDSPLGCCGRASCSARRPPRVLNVISGDAAGRPLCVAARIRDSGRGAGSAEASGGRPRGLRASRAAVGVPEGRRCDRPGALWGR
ncbi:aldehyde dehydrogenase family protein [Streptomyces sp. QH1-20]|uniref:aldehyde dehydrogenase family protein n=1 Tax=Streptomyces sp. QH1-20 TaxID=3240934 RepID=UPI0035189F1A